MEDNGAATNQDDTFAFEVTNTSGTWSDLPARRCQDRLERPLQKHFWRLEQFLWGSVKNRFKNLNTLWRKDTCRTQKNTRRTASMRSLQLESLRVDRTSSNGATRACDS